MILSYSAFVCFLVGCSLVVTAMVRRPRGGLHYAVALTGLSYAAWALGFVFLFSHRPVLGAGWNAQMVTFGMFVFPVSLFWAWLCLARVPVKKQVLILLPFVAFVAFLFVTGAVEKMFWPDFRALEWTGLPVSRDVLLPWIAMAVFGVMQALGFRLLVQAKARLTSSRLKQQLSFIIYQTLAGNALYFVVAAIGNALSLPPLGVLTVVYPLSLNFYLISKYRYLKWDQDQVERGAISVMDEALIVVDSDLKIIRISQAASELFSRTSALKTSDAARLFDDPDAFRADWEQAMAGEQKKGASHSAGGRTLLVSVAPIQDSFGDRIGGAILVRKRDPMEFASETLKFSEREKDISGLLLQGFSNQGIASALFISPATVRTHIYNIFKKARVKNRLSLMRKLTGTPP